MDDFLPLRRIAALDNALNDNSCEPGEVNTIPCILPKQMGANYRCFLNFRHVTYLGQ